jgi:hypothetical protein
MATPVYPFLDAGYFGYLGIPLLILWMEPHKQQFLLYLVICVLLAGIEGLAIGCLYWFLFGVVRIFVDAFDLNGLLRIRGDAV